MLSFKHLYSQNSSKLWWRLVCWRTEAYSIHGYQRFIICLHPANKVELTRHKTRDMGHSRLTFDPLLLSSDWCHLCACFLSVINQCKKINNRKQHGGTSLNTATAWKCPHFAHVLMRKVPKLPRVLTNIYVQVDVHTFSLYLIFKPKTEKPALRVPHRFPTMWFLYPQL